MVGDGMKALHKDFWMEIRKSKARFISIFLIVALGVAFFFRDPGVFSGYEIFRRCLL